MMPRQLSKQFNGMKQQEAFQTSGKIFVERAAVKSKFVKVLFCTKFLYGFYNSPISCIRDGKSGVFFVMHPNKAGICIISSEIFYNSA